MKQFTIRGSMEYPARFEGAIELLARRNLSALVTHRYPLERFPDALATLAGSKECGKVMVVMGPDHRSMRRDKVQRFRDRLERTSVR
jgi:threonine dehydrogenase-like Zn-dependent dehydrogenase